MAVAGATGISRGAAHTVAALLLSDIRMQSNHLLTLTNVNLVGREPLDGLECYLLRGSETRSDDTTLWIAVNDFSLCRLKEDKLITAEECEQAMAEEIAAMLERGDDVGDLENAEIKDMQYIEQCTYEQVRFDAVIPPAVFAEQDL